MTDIIINMTAEEHSILISASIIAGLFGFIVGTIRAKRRAKGPSPLPKFRTISELDDLVNRGEEVRGDARAVLEAVVRDLKAATEKKTDEDTVDAMNDVIIDAESILEE